MSASNMPSWAFVCLPEQTTSLNVAASCAPSTDPKISPIDDLMQYFGSVMLLGDSKALDRNDILGRVLLLGLVSGAETYFRTLLTRLLTICPISRSVASEQMLSLGSIDYYGADNIGFGLLEGVSFVSEGEILKQTKRLAGITWDADKSSVAAAIKQFETLSHLRHAAVHARGELGNRNLKAMQIPAGGRLSLVVRFPQLQDAAQICLNAARAYNRHLFHELVQRWIGRRQLSGSWEGDRVLFSKLTSLFTSRQDSIGGPRFKKYLYLTLQPSITSALASMARATAAGK